MRVLFVGDFDMAGTAIASRIYREGGRISWLTAEPSRSLWARKVRGRVFRSDRPISHGALRQAFGGDTVDCVVVLTASWREGVHAESQPAGSLLRLIDETLEVALAAQAGTVCLLSSERIADNRVLGAGLEELRAGERMAEAFCATHDLKLLTLRFGHLFGATDLASTLVGRIMDDLASGSVPSLPYSADSQIDLIAASDLADAFLRLANLRATGTHTVLTGRPVTAQSVVETAAAAAGVDLDLDSVAFADFSHRCAESSAEQDGPLCGWRPLHPFDEEGAEQLRAARDVSFDTRKKEAPSAWWKRLKDHPVLWPLLQNLLAFAVACGLASLAKDFSDLRYVDVRLLYVIVIAVCFGMRQGIIATVLACASYAGALILSGIDLSYLLYSVSSWVPFIVYGVAGAFGGYWSDKKNDEYDAIERERTELSRRYDVLKDLYREVVEIKNRLQKQIMVTKDSLNNLYAITSELDAESPLLLIARTVRVTEELMGCDAVAIHILSDEGRWARLAVCSSSLTDVLAPSLDLESLPGLRTALDGDLFVNTELDRRYPSMALAARTQDMAVLVSVYHLPLERFTVDYGNRFRTLVKMVGDNLLKAFDRRKSQLDAIYIPGTRILTASAFEEELKVLRQMNDVYGFPSSVAVIADARNEQASTVDVSKRTEELLRKTDLLGLGGDGMLRAAFVCVGADRRPQLEERLAESGLTVRWEG